MKGLLLDYKKLAAILICAALGGGALYLLVRYLLPVLLPFLLSWGLALLLRPVAVWLGKRLHLPLRAVAALTTLGALLLVGGMATLAVRRLVMEIRSAAAYLRAEPDLFAGLFSDLLNGSEELGLLFGVERWINALWEQLTTALLEAVPPLVGNAVLSLPGVLLFLLVAIVSAFYFSLDLAKVHATVRAILPKRIADSLGQVRQGAMRLGLGYLRSYLILTGVIFLIMLTGLSLLSVEYALLLSLLLAAVDSLPVVGVGTVLIPWGILSLATGETSRGVGLLLLFAVSEIARQILEPRLLGSALGIHPLVSLLSLYGGVRLFGFLGLVAGPLLAVLLKLLFSRLTQGEKTKNPSYDGISVGHTRSTLPERRQREQT